MAALTYVNHLKKQSPDLGILLTTTSVTSADLLEPKLKKIGCCLHQFSVADHPYWVKKFLDYWQPCAAFFLESEIWPNIMDELHTRKVPTLLINARLSQKSFARWSLLKQFFSSTLGKFTVILAQSDLDATRYAFFSPNNTLRMDNLKYANDTPPCNEELLNTFRKICAGKKVLVAGSTHGGEEEIILKTHLKLKEKIPIVTIIIPRHLIRVEEVCNIFRQNNVFFALRSDKNVQEDCEVFCVDTFGEMGTFFRLADVCFVGGSLVPVGGHNILEPVALGKPVLHGPFMDNALEIRDFLRNLQVSFEVKNEEEMSEICQKLLKNSSLLNEISRKASTVVRNDSLKQIDEFVKAFGIL
jgi:3-deoxy-D-manno-octulosonic-acid transferase